MRLRSVWNTIWLYQAFLWLAFGLILLVTAVIFGEKGELLVSNLACASVFAILFLTWSYRKARKLKIAG
jgi:hypothetical protein